MGQRQFYIEEGFTSHPKVIEAGGDAGWLHLCALDWASQKLTGHIPKRLVPQLSDRRSPHKLAARLVAAGLWHDRGDHYELHDWEQRNQKMLAARRKAKHAAEVRHGKPPKDAPSNAPSTPQAMLDDCSPDASRAGARVDPTIQRSNDPTIGVTISETLQAQRSVRPAAAPPEVVTQALNLLVDRRIDGTRTPILNSNAYRSVTLSCLRSEHLQTINELDPGVAWTPELLADWLEPSRPVLPVSQPAPAPLAQHQTFHPLGCVCAGQGTDRTCTTAPVDA